MRLLRVGSADAAGLLAFMLEVFADAQLGGFGVCREALLAELGVFVGALDQGRCRCSGGQCSHDGIRGNKAALVLAVVFARLRAHKLAGVLVA
jgi:hypothetical protein